MSTCITLDHVLVDTGSVDNEGYLAYLDGRLIAVLIQLDPELHGDLRVGRHWYLEAGFGPIANATRPLPFPTLDDAKAWLAGCVGVHPPCLPPCLRDVPAPRPPRSAWTRPTCGDRREGGRPEEA
ncbi:hypothetical protein [Methylobacterium sp. 17Sr1-1]|uniref:hypothetical protein n=1 Tax=Methylobacterium sp. 17Sr1-1 TaxID=2202826 RepID=UPI001950AC20|nr:hypothetical protein [Methylobacterium sp. 17Sr1-1]